MITSTDVLDVIGAPPGANNPGSPKVIEAYREALACLAEQFRAEPCPPGRHEGRGVVVGAGGAKYFGCAWVCFSMARWLGCSLPFQFWHLGRGEMDPQMRAAAEAVDIEVVDARTVAAALPTPPRILNGWELKPFAVMHSKFREVLYLDADCLPVVNPEFLFDTPEYRRHGAVFWPDLPPNSKSEWLNGTCWYNFGLEYRKEPAFETGQFLIDKGRCWDALRLTCWVNEHSDYFYRFLFGDKDTFHLAWRKIGREYAMPPTPAGWHHPSILQHDFSGRRVFEHACRGKERLCAGDRVPGTWSNQYQDAARVLAARWSRAIWNAADETPEERRLAREVAGTYRYVRRGIGERHLELRADGSIGLGAAGCEKRWTLRLLDGTPTVVVVGEAHKGSEVGMMFLTETAPGTWTGRWEYHEQGPVELLRTGPGGEPPAAWYCRPGTWDRELWDCVVRDNEYALPPAFRGDDVIVDVGACSGTFSYACLERGAGTVWSCEPEPDNYAVLCRNLGGRYPGRHHALPAAVVGEGVAAGEAVNLAGAGGPNVGAFWLDPGGTGTPVPALRLKTLLSLATLGGRRRVRLLKLDCEGCEFACLPGADLSLVDEVVGEYHEGHAGLGQAVPHTRQALEQALLAAGFAAVQINPSGEYLGHFRALRPQPAGHPQAGEGGSS